MGIDPILCFFNLHWNNVESEIWFVCVRLLWFHITGEVPWLNFLLMEIRKVIWPSPWRNCKLMIPRVLNCAELWLQDTLSSCFLFTKTKRIPFSQLLDIVYARFVPFCPKWWSKITPPNLDIAYILACIVVPSVYTTYIVGAFAIKN